MKADGSIVLDLSTSRAATPKLAMLFARVDRRAPGRKITLKINRPDFFVVSGEEGGRKIYERMAKAPAEFVRSQSAARLPLCLSGWPSRRSRPDRRGNRRFLRAVPGARFRAGGRPSRHGGGDARRRSDAAVRSGPAVSCRHRLPCRPRSGPQCDRADDCSNPTIEGQAGKIPSRGPATRP